MNPPQYLGLTSITLAIFPVMSKVPGGTYLPGLVSIYCESGKNSSRNSDVQEFTRNEPLLRREALADSSYTRKENQVSSSPRLRR